jgi:hypothetical protein
MQSIPRASVFPHFATKVVGVPAPHSGCGALVRLVRLQTVAVSQIAETERRLIQQRKVASAALVRGKRTVEKVVGHTPHTLVKGQRVRVTNVSGLLGFGHCFVVEWPPLLAGPQFCLRPLPAFLQRHAQQQLQLLALVTVHTR